MGGEKIARADQGQGIGHVHGLRLHRMGLDVMADMLQGQVAGDALVGHECSSPVSDVTGGT